MDKVLWRVINILSILLSFLALLLQIAAVAVGSWKEIDVSVGQLDLALYNVYMHRRTGLLNSRIVIEHIELGDFVVDTPNKFPTSTGKQLRLCLDGPSLKRVLSVCTSDYQSSDCRCVHLPHWIALAVLEFLALMLCVLLVVCCFLLRTYPQAFLKTITFVLAALTALVLMTGFILIFQYWSLDVSLLLNILPQILQNILMHYYQIRRESFKNDMNDLHHDYVYDNIHIYPSWSAFLSLGSFISVSALTCFLVLSWVIDRQHSKKERRLNIPNATSGTYRPIRS